MCSRICVVIVAIACISCRAQAPIGKVRVVVRDTKSRVTDMALSPDGQSFATIREVGTLQIWDAVLTRPIKEIKMAGNGRSIAFWKNDRIVAAWGGAESDSDSAVVVWDCGTGLPIAKFPVSPVIDVSCVCVSEKLQLMISGGTLLQGGFSITGNQAERRFKSIEVWSEEGVVRFATGNFDKLVGYDAELSRSRQDISECRDNVNCVAVDPNGIHLLAAGEDDNSNGVIMKFDITEGVLLWRRASLDYCVGSGVFCNRFRSVAIRPIASRYNSNKTPSNPDRVSILDAATGEEQMQLRTGHNRVTAIASNDRRNVIATGGDDGIVTVWKSDDGTKLGSLKSDLSEITALMFIDSQDQLVVADTAGTICCYEFDRSSTR